MKENKQTPCLWKIGNKNGIYYEFKAIEIIEWIFKNNNLTQISCH